MKSSGQNQGDTLMSDKPIPDYQKRAYLEVGRLYIKNEISQEEIDGLHQAFDEVYQMGVDEGISKAPRLEGVEVRDD